MNKLIQLIIASTFISPAFAAHGAGTYEETCYRYEYSEEYVPGTSRNPGYVRRDRNKVQVPCNGYGQGQVNHQSEDGNSCREGAILGGIVGAAGGAALSRNEGRFIGIPLGIVTGALVGCQVDGG